MTVNSNGYLDFFTNTEADWCYPHNCNLRTWSSGSGCSGSSFSTTGLSITNAGSLQADMSTFSGTHSFCVECTSAGGNDLKYGEVIVTGSVSCGSSLSAVSSLPTIPNRPYSSSSTLFDIVDWDDVFQNGDTSNCAITSCTIYESDCSTSYTGSNLSGLSSLPFTIQGK